MFVNWWTRQSLHQALFLSSPQFAVLSPLFSLRSHLLPCSACPPLSSCPPLPSLSLSLSICTFTLHPCTAHTCLQQLSQTHRRIRGGSKCVGGLHYCVSFHRGLIVQGFQRHVDEKFRWGKKKSPLNKAGLGNRQLMSRGLATDTVWLSQESLNHVHAPRHHLPREDDVHDPHSRSKVAHQRPPSERLPSSDRLVALSTSVAFSAHVLHLWRLVNC